MIVSNAFVVKLNPAGTALLYAGFLGYYENVFGQGIDVDVNQLAYVTGKVSPNITPTVIITPPNTNPPPFPITANAAQPTFVGNDYDAFVTVISSTGDSFLYSTYLGAGQETGYGIAVDKNADAYVTGLTYSTGFPVTAGAYQSTYEGAGDAFFSEINTNASGAAGLVYSTFLGGTGLDPVSYTHLDVYKRQPLHAIVNTITLATNANANVARRCLNFRKVVSIKSCLLYTSRCV